MPYWHITLASRGRVTLFPTEARLRAAVGKLATVSGTAVLLFDIVDDHLHEVAEAESQAAANQLSRRMQLSLGSVAEVRFFGRDVAPVESRAHLKGLVRYLLTQPQRHGLPVHPALWSGSSFLDLAGARWLPDLRPRLKQALPRLGWTDLLEILGLPADPLSPLTDAQLAACGVEQIAAASSSAINVAPEMNGADRATTLARRCAVSLGRHAGYRRADVARVMGWSLRSLTRYAAVPPPEEALTAVRRRLALEQLVARASSGVMGTRSAAFGGVG